MSFDVLNAVEAYRRLNHRRTWRERLCRWAAWWLVAALAALLLDIAWTAIGAVVSSEAAAVISMPPLLRWAIVLGLAGAAVVLIARLAMAHLGRVRPSVDDARQLEQRLGISGNVLVNGWTFATDSQPTDSNLTTALRHRCIDQANARAHQIDVRSAVDMARARRWGRAFLVLVIAIALLVGLDAAWLGGAALGRASARLATPWRPTPPPALCRIVMEHQPEAIGLGDDVQIDAAALGLVLTGAHLQWLDASGGVDQAVPMTDRGPADSTWRLTLKSLAEPVRLRLVAGGSYFGPVTLTPHPRPKLLGVRLSIIPEASQATDTNPPIAMPADQLDRSVALAIGSQLGITAISDQPGARLMGQSNQAKRIIHQVDPGRQTIVLELISPQGLRSTDPMTLHLVGLTDDQLSRLNDTQAQSAAQSGQDRARPDDRPAPLILSEAQPVDQLTAPTDLGAMDRAQSATLTDGTPAADTTASPGTARTDEASARPTTGQTSEHTQPGRTGGVWEADATTDDPLARGVRQADAEDGGAPDPQISLLIDQTPPAYRQLVEAYFQRIARDLEGTTP